MVLLCDDRRAQQRGRGELHTCVLRLVKRHDESCSSYLLTICNSGMNWPDEWVIQVPLVDAAGNFSCSAEASEQS